MPNMMVLHPLHKRGSSLNLAVSKRKEILQWLSPEPYLQHHKQMKQDVLDGTGGWLLEDPVFQKWKGHTVSSVLWLHGIPGSGKSKLVCANSSDLSA
jgi:hypothetical protein